MTTVGMNYEVREGKEQAFEKKFALVQDVMKDIPGHVRTFLYRNAYQGSSYLVISEWESRGSFDAFIASAEFRSVTAWGEANILTARPKHSVYGEEAAPISGGCSHANVSSPQACVS